MQSLHLAPLLRACGFAAVPIALAVMALVSNPKDAQAYTWCGVTNDSGGSGSYGWQHWIVRWSDQWFGSGDTGQRGQAYDIWGDSTPTSTIDMIDVIYMRYWYCGSLAGTYAPSPYYNSPGDGYFFGYTALNNCGWQADSYVEFYEAGHFDDLSYIDDP